MPYAPARPCVSQPCPELVTRGTRCAAHQHAVDLERGTAAARGYGSAWQRLRARFLRSHPLCATGCGAPASDVDHIRPRRDGGSDAWDNLQALCGAHHKRKTALQSSGWGNRG